MKLAACLLVICLGTRVLAADFPQSEEVQIVSTISFKPAEKEGLQFIGHCVLDRFQVADGEGPPAWAKVSGCVVVSGRVVSNNAGGGLENIAVYVNSTLHEPRLVALTNADGEFKFRLGVRDDNRRWPVEVTPEWEGDLLLLSGHRYGPPPNPLFQGRVYRYSLQKLKQFADK